MWLSLGIIFSLGILIPGKFSLKLQYDRDQVLHIVPETIQQVHHLQLLCSTFMLDLWKPLLPEDIRAGEDLHIRVPAPLVQEVKESLAQHMISHRVLIPDVQKLVDQSMPREKSSHREVSGGYVYTEYHPMEEIYQWMTQIQKNNSELVTQHILGKTFENRTMYYLQISQPSNKTKKIIWMDCGIHAREWISPAFCQWFVKEILQNYKTDPKISRFLQNLDFYVLPVLNIDGYIYSWEKDRLWRKSRSPYENGTCYGTDLNRNFNSSWGSVGVSFNCSSDVFCGSGPESEPETRAVAQFIRNKKSDILCYLTIHSYGQLILTPYGSTTTPPSNNEELMQVAKEAAAALTGKYGTSYKVGSTALILYSNSGSSRDWAHTIGIPLSYTFELRDTGTHGFVLPTDQIQPTCEETMLAVTTIIDYVDKKYFTNGDVVLTSSSLGLSLCLSIVLTWIPTFNSIFLCFNFDGIKTLLNIKGYPTSSSSFPISSEEFVSIQCSTSVIEVYPIWFQQRRCCKSFTMIKESKILPVTPTLKPLVDDTDSSVSFIIFFRHQWD
ncbi:carboxypeptidase O [Ammospiza caudacuta]|uniref:carboxypeptidase O n=1 Tax=Ammospiza caudacuta TaxID=2857398 RepID=UPI0027392F1F|nr:carboxypeptidase O [Ammospiza caudacuta]